MAVHCISDFQSMVCFVRQVTKNEGLRFLASKAVTIDEMETFIPTWVHRKMAAKWHPKFVHALKVRNFLCAAVHTGMHSM